MTTSCTAPSNALAQPQNVAGVPAERPNENDQHSWLNLIDASTKATLNFILNTKKRDVKEKEMTNPDPITPNEQETVMAEWEKWLALCDVLKETGAVTEADCASNMEANETPGQRLFIAIREWGDAFALSSVYRARRFGGD